MTRSLRARFILDLTGNLAGTARRFGRAFERLGRDGDRELGRVGRAAAELDRRLNRGLVRGAQVGTAALTLGLGVSIARIGTLEERLIRLGHEIGKEPVEMLGRFREELNAIANAPDIRIDTTKLLGALEVFQELTGRLDVADAIKRELAQVISATGLAGEEVGANAAVMFQKFGFTTGDQFASAFDTIIKQGGAGSISLQEFARIAPKVLSAYSAFGKGGLDGFAEAVAMAQVFRENVGTSEEAATVFENVMRNLFDRTKLKNFEKAGVNVRGDDGALLGPVELMKAVIESAAEHVRRKGVSDEALPGEIELLLGGAGVDAEAMRGIRAMISMFVNEGGFERFDALSNMRGDGSVVQERSSDIASSVNASGRAARNNFEDVVEDLLIPPLKALTDSLNALIGDGVKFTMDDALNLALGGAAAVGGAKLTLGALRMMSGGGRKGAPPPGAPASPGGDGFVTPVWVMNWPVGFGAGVGVGGTERDGKNAKGKRGKVNWLRELLESFGPSARTTLYGMGFGAAAGGVQQGDDAMMRRLEDRLAAARRPITLPAPAGFRGMGRDRREETAQRRAFVLRRQAERAAAPRLIDADQAPAPAGFRGMERDRREETAQRRAFVLRRQAELAAEQARSRKDEYLAARRAQLEAGGSALTGALDFGRDPRVDELIEAVRENGDETEAMARRLERAIALLGGKLAPRERPLGPDPRTGRIMTGPQ